VTPGELEVVVDQWEAAWDGSAEDGFAACCTPDVSYEDPLLLEPVEGVEALDRHAARVREALPDLRMERTAPRLHTASHACMPWRVLGTHKGDVGGVPASGRFVIVHGVHYAELADGLIRRARGFFDLYDAAVQLGMLPARGGLGEAALLLLRGFGLRPRS
jgi:steroid delta-isomerase-like uncharacterized protein